MVVALAVFPTATLQAQPADGYVIVSGSAAYRQRIAMPPDAVLTVRVEDVSRADAPAPVLAETSEPFGARQVPIAFSLNVPSATIDPRFSYAVRATITVDGKLRFTTTRSYAVLTRGAPNHVDLMLDAVQPPPTDAPAGEPGSTTAPAAGVSFALPSTFAGVVPCADCPGVAQTLTLRADGLYRLRRTYLGKRDAPFAEQGRWTADERGKRLTLRSGPETLLLEVRDNVTLRLLDRLGQPITSNANLDLRRTAQVDPVSELQDNVTANLKDTYWKLIELDGAAVVMAPAQKREVRITLASEGSRLFGFSGCNQLVGAYVQESSALRFTQMASTKMACVPPFMELENRVLKMLGATTAYRIEGEKLTLLGGDQVLARFEAVYLH